MEESGRFVNESAWKQAEDSIQKLLDKIHNSYSRIGKKKQVQTSYLYFDDSNNQKLIDAKNILLIDDVTTTD